MNPSQAQTSEWWKFFAPKALSRAWRVPGQRWALGGLAVVFLTIIAFVGVRPAAPIESHVFTKIDKWLRFRVQPGPGHVERAGAGPYDETLGFSQLPEFTARLQQNEYTITAQARVPRLARLLAVIGLSGIYHEKTQRADHHRRRRRAVVRSALSHANLSGVPLDSTCAGEHHPIY